MSSEGRVQTFSIARVRLKGFETLLLLIRAMTFVFGLLFVYLYNKKTMGNTTSNTIPSMANINVIIAHGLDQRRRQEKRDAADTEKKCERVDRRI